VKEDGFTLVEMLVVMAALALLLSVSAPAYLKHLDRSRETVLRHNLAGLRDAIDKFHADRARYPQSLQELVDQKYLRAVPLDPVTDRMDSWVLVPARGGATPGVFDVKSGAAGASRGGTNYADW
jgi:general secretion pathway protein G